MFCNGGSQKTSRNASFGESALQKTSRFATNLRARAQPAQVAAQTQPALQQKRPRQPPQAAKHTDGHHLHGFSRRLPCRTKVTDQMCSHCGYTCFAQAFQQLAQAGLPSP